MIHSDDHFGESIIITVASSRRVVRWCWSLYIDRNKNVEGDLLIIWGLSLRTRIHQERGLKKINNKLCSPRRSRSSDCLATVFLHFIRFLSV
jgi:hypothetical protein